ncbi:hypothetical protein A7U60_g7499 [Sanghuangporus baumii]|uniref:Small ribosomal subunit protein mS29 n=1 Tax=Sanghuangporus baumii TaxID=108892 RepID=A0A9Q5N9K1_SANBA|nr:hypothetical protein A7U60_g7499 [Sanghuangporus baumii]
MRFTFRIAFTNNKPSKKKKDKKPRDKVPPPLLPLPANQTTAFGGQFETGLEMLPAIKKGEYPEKYYGKAIRFGEVDRPVLKTFGLPRNIFVDFRILSTPCSVSRRMTESIAKRLDSASQEPSTNNRLIMTGSAGCGKSYLMLQQVAYALANEWIVMYIPRAHKLVDSSTAYFYDPRTQMYLQPTASNQILQRFLSVNRKLIDQLQLTRDVAFEKRESVAAGQPLKSLFPIAGMEQHMAPMILSIVLEELGKQEKFPVLLVVDEFQALYCKTEYRNQHYEHIKSYHLSLPRLLMEYASGKRTLALYCKTEYRNQHYEHIKSYHLSLPRLLMEYASGKRTLNRGAVLGAISSSITQYPLGPELKQALSLDEHLNPYTKLRKGLLEYTQGLEPLRVPDKLEYDEAIAMFEIWKKDRALHSEPTDELFLSIYSESSGNARDFVHGGLLATQNS